MVKCCVLFEVRTKFINIIMTSFGLKGLKRNPNHGGDLVYSYITLSGNERSRAGNLHWVQAESNRKPATLSLVLQVPIDHPVYNILFTLLYSPLLPSP
jgi:hypothetical protein